VSRSRPRADSTAPDACHRAADISLDLVGRVVSVADPPNLRSLAVMHRLDFVYDHSAELEEHGIRFQAVIHSITADQWRRTADREACPCPA
jgi:RimJ/RimL family protein N-acetyltransferase